MSSQGKGLPIGSSPQPCSKPCQRQTFALTWSVLTPPSATWSWDSHKPAHKSGMSQTHVAVTPWVAAYSLGGDSLNSACAGRKLSSVLHFGQPYRLLWRHSVKEAPSETTSRLFLSTRATRWKTQWMQGPGLELLSFLGYMFAGVSRYLQDSPVVSRMLPTWSDWFIYRNGLHVQVKLQLCCLRLTVPLLPVCNSEHDNTNDSSDTQYKF